MFTFSCSWCWSHLVLTYYSFTFVEMGGGNWCSPMLGVWNGNIFLFLHGQHCFIQDLWLIAFFFSWMWPCCLRRGGVLVGTLHPQSKSYTSCVKHFPSLVSKKKRKEVGFTVIFLVSTINIILPIKTFIQLKLQY